MFVVILSFFKIYFSFVFRKYSEFQMKHANYFEDCEIYMTASMHSDVLDDVYAGSSDIPGLYMPETSPLDRIYTKNTPKAGICVMIWYGPFSYFMLMAL
jgi:hypothetical protein